MPSFDLSEGDALARWLEESSGEAVHRGLLSAGFRLLGVITSEIIPQEKPPPIFDGAYRAAWRVQTVEGGAEVLNDMPYAGPIEDGVRAENVKIGRPMIEALAEWVRRKGLTGHAPGKRSSPETRAEARQIAWAIARAMQGTPGKEGKGIFNRDGKQGLGIARKAAERAPEIVADEVQREFSRRFK